MPPFALSVNNDTRRGRIWLESKKPPPPIPFIAPALGRAMRAAWKNGSTTVIILPIF
jgi:hypothetical protein